MKSIYHNRLARLVLAAVLVLTALTTGDLHACSVPVFRYALERWQPNDYFIEIIHKGELTARAKDAAATLDRALNEQAGINLKISYTDSNAPEEPLMAVYYPFDKDKQAAIQTVPLTADAVDKLIDSPVRKEIAKRLLDGDSAVWILLESADPAKDNAAAALITEQLKIAAEQIILPDVEAKDANAAKVTFSSVRLSRDDPKEQLIVNLLLGIEADLHDFNEPMLWPVFGRGRVLLPLIGNGITKENIIYACQYLCGPCACTIKFENPGFDLPMKADWQLVQQMYDADAYIDELTVVSVTPQANQPAENILDFTTDTSPDELINTEKGFTQIIFWAFAAIVIIVAVMSFILIRRTSNK